MKIKFFKNDKSTVMDEIMLSIITLTSLGLGLGLIIIKPEFGVITSSTTCTFGVAWVMLAIMYMPYLIYRFFSNTIKDDSNK